jgi:hypothetical protein
MYLISGDWKPIEGIPLPFYSIRVRVVLKNTKKFMIPEKFMISDPRKYRERLSRVRS